jgi:hypothetical protein
VKRRSFIFISLVGATTIAIPLLNCNNRDKAIKKYLAQPSFLSHICDAKTIREIGYAYKAQFPAEAKEELLVNLLLAGGTDKLFSHSPGNSLINSFLDKKIQQDFKTGKTVIVNGWILSVTEAKQCALFSMIQY